MGVGSTARQARGLGLRFAMVGDVMTDVNPRPRVESVEAIFPRLGAVGRTEEVIVLPDLTHS
ncbi:MAG: hypothetical protein B7X31_06510 [Thiomonas sp. 13-66-29]|nr:MAG: hypothetical protein B7X46_07860 [Thiomonas sp. 15-66-11]OZB63246.1 MAG: hypothetical protein B7X31_06510 [Thiomonas sp. 13-66-29]